MTNCEKFSRTLQWMIRRLHCWRLKDNSCLCKARSRNRNLTCRTGESGYSAELIEADPELEAAKAKHVQAKQEIAILVEEQTAEKSQSRYSDRDIVRQSCTTNHSLNGIGGRGRRRVTVFPQARCHWPMDREFDTTFRASWCMQTIVQRALGERISSLQIIGQSGHTTLTDSSLVPASYAPAVCSSLHTQQGCDYFSLFMTVRSTVGLGAVNHSRIFVTWVAISLVVTQLVEDAKTLTKNANLRSPKVVNILQCNVTAWRRCIDSCVGVLALLRTRCYSKALSMCTDEPGALALIRAWR